MNLRDENGTVINADFSLAFTDGRPSIIVESSGGASQKSGRGRRNPDYNDLMSLLLRILARRRYRIGRIGISESIEPAAQRTHRENGIRVPDAALANRCRGAA